MIKKIKKWFKELSYIKCDYCGNKVPVVWEAFNLPTEQNYKGACICADCIKELPQENIVYG